MDAAATEDLDIRPGVAAVLVDPEERVLLHRRKVGGGWAPISGHVEPGETIQAALHREVQEETRLTITRERLVAIYSDPAIQIVTYADGRRVHFVTCLFTATVESGQLRGSAEGTAWAWFTPGQLPTNLMPYARVWLTDAMNNTGQVLHR